MDPLAVAKIRVSGVEVRVVDSCASTNTQLREERSVKPALLVAELQTAGRGRHGRRWRSARGAGATFSIRWRMNCDQRKLAGLSVAMGICSARALRRLGARGVTLKWPNDLMVNRRKLGGILIETRSLPRPGSRPLPRPDSRPASHSSPAGTLVIVGIGINCRAQPRLGAHLGRGIAALEDVMRRPVSRNAVIGAVAREVTDALAAWDRAQAHGLERPLERAA